ncbi:MAG: class I SAM-dependent methyltransferase [Pseudomonadota bacterium]
MPDPSSFWDRMAASYSKSAVRDPASYAEKLARTQALLSPQSTVLEIGCGTGSTAITHAPHARHITATDLSEAMLEIARKKAAAAGVENVTFTRVDVSDLKRQGAVTDAAPYDMVMAHSLLHLLPDPQATIRDAYALIRPGGLFVSSTMCLDDRHWFLRPIAGIARLVGLFPGLNFFTRKRLMSWMPEPGFEIVDEWQPGPRKAVFVIARRPESSDTKG